MKIALLCPIPVLPAFGGNRSRIVGLTRAVRSLGHELYFVSVPSQLSERPDVDAHRAEFGERFFLELPSDRIESAAFRLRQVPQKVRRRALRPFGTDASYYYGLDEFCPPAFLDDLRALQISHGFHAVICEYVFYSLLLEAFPKGVLKVLDTHDSFANRHRLYTDRSAYWYSVPAAEQVRGFRRADSVVAIQSTEAELFARELANSGTEVVEVSHILNVDAPIDDYASDAALLLGSANRANIGSALYLIADVLPKVRAVLPDFRLHLAGQLCGAVPDAPGVTKLGTVDDLRAAFQSAPVSLNPMLTGTGINIKLLDAMAHAVPTVSTQTGARGLDNRYRAGIVTVADDDPQGFAEEIVRLARDPSLRESLGRAAHADATAWNIRQLSSLERLFSRAA